MATEEEQQPVAEAIKSLPMRLRKPFVMAHVQRMPRSEIAAELHIPERQVDKRLARALVACHYTAEGRAPVSLTVLRWIATPAVLLLFLLVHAVYLIVVRVCALLGLRPPRPWLQ